MRPSLAVDELDSGYESSKVDWEFEEDNDEDESNELSSDVDELNSDDDSTNIP